MYKRQRLFYWLRAGPRAGAPRELRALGGEDAVAPRSRRSVEASVDLRDLAAEGAAIAFGFDDGVLGASLGSAWYPLPPR